jgi:ketosteroid isomerase-like protein
MSRENVEIVRGQIDAFNRGEFAAALALLDEDVEWQVPQIAALDAPASGVLRGRNEMVETFARWLEAWETYAFQTTEVLGHRDNVFVAGLQTGRGRNSGLDIGVLTFHVLTVRNGKIVAMRTFSERADALEAAGLSKQGAHADS